MSDSESEIESLPDVESEDEIEVKPKKSEKKKVYRSLSEISTEGVVGESPLYSGLSLSDRNGLLDCDACGKFFRTDMVTHTEGHWGKVCYHCLFFMHYVDRAKVDGVDGRIRIVDYIQKCAATHKSLAVCPRKSDTGGCILCEYNFGIPLEGIKNPEVLGGEPKKKRPERVVLPVPKDEKDIFQDSGVSVHHSSFLEL